MKYFALVMSAVYVLAGCGLIFSGILIDLIPKYRVPLGIVIAGYGVVRFFLWQRRNARASDTQ